MGHYEDWVAHYFCDVATPCSGVILTIDHPTSYGYINAFTLGARAAIADGVASISNVSIPAWVLGTFDDLSAEVTAAEDLVRRGIDVLLILSNHNNYVREYIYQKSGQSVLSFGIYSDARLSDGDHVLLSAEFVFKDVFEGVNRRAALLHF
jgi:basic membrane lipoprotein Med (substrate-binding protein (PBP1-ABC) superfamily)